MSSRPNIRRTQAILTIDVFKYFYENKYGIANYFLKTYIKIFYCTDNYGNIAESTKFSNLKILENY